MAAHDDVRVQGGSILLARTLLDSEVWSWDSDHIRFFVYLLLSVNASEVPIVIGSVEVGYGQVLKSIRRIADENEHLVNQVKTRWSTSRVHRMMARFERAGVISTARKKASDLGTPLGGDLGTPSGGDLGTLITLLNFNRYQDFQSYTSDLGTPQEGGLGTPSGGDLGTITIKPLPSLRSERGPRELSRDEVFGYWERRRKEVLGRTGGPSMKRTRKRLSKISARLREGYSVNDLQHAIDGCLSNQANVDGGYLDIELICRDQQHVEQYLAWFKNGHNRDSSDERLRPFGDSAARIVT